MTQPSWVKPEELKKQTFIYTALIFLFIHFFNTKNFLIKMRVKFASQNKTLPVICISHLLIFIIVYYNISSRLCFWLPEGFDALFGGSPGVPHTDVGLRDGE